MSPLRLRPAVIAIAAVSACAAGGETIDSATRALVRDLLDAGEPRAAIELLEKRDPSSAQDWTLLAFAYRMATDRAPLLRKLALARKQKSALQRALELDPEHVEARTELADYYFYAPRIAGGDRREAARQAAALEAVSPLAAHRLQARHAWAEEDFAAAAEHLAAAVALEPGSMETRLELGTALERAGRIDAAFEAFAAAAAELPEDPRADYQVGRLAAVDGTRAELGIRSLERFLERAGDETHPPPAYGWWRLAQLRAARGEHDAARAHLERALELDPSLARARDDLERLTAVP